MRGPTKVHITNNHATRHNTGVWLKRRMEGRATPQGKGEMTVSTPFGYHDQRIGKTRREAVLRVLVLLT
jgi:hypothetical protein